MPLARQSERGFAIVLVLLFAASVAGLASSMLIERKRGAEVSLAAELMLKRRIALDSALEIVVARLRDPASEPFKKMTIPVAGFNVEVAVTAENSKIDLNLAATEDLERWISGHSKNDSETAQIMAHRIVDWRDPDSLRSLYGAEANDYSWSGLDYGPANAPFQHVGELRDVLGMTPELFASLAPEAAIATGREESVQTLDTENDGNDDSANSEDDSATPSEEGHVYRLELIAKARDRGQLHSQVIVWIEPTKTDRNYETLDYEPFMLVSKDQ